MINWEKMTDYLIILYAIYFRIIEPLDIWKKPDHQFDGVFNILILS